MKIAIWHNLPSGGGKRALYNHTKALKERGHFIESWTTDCSNESYLPLSKIVKEARTPLYHEIDKANKIKDPLKRAHKVNSLLKANAKICAREIDSKNFDIVFANSCMFTNMPYIGLYLNTPCAIYLGEPFRRLFEATENFNVWELPKKKSGLKFLYRWYKDYRANYANRFQLTEEINAAKRYSRILVNSLFSRESVKRAYGIDSEVCYLGINENEFIHMNFPKKNYVVGLGTIASHKNVHLVIEVVSKISSSYRPQIYWIANSFDPEYFENVKKLANEKRVDFIPLIDISDHEVNKVLSKAIVMLYMPHLEPFGLAPLEANASGTFVLALAEGGVRETICHGQNGFLAKDLNEIVEFLNSMLQNPGTALSYGKKAREYVCKEWSYGNMTNNIEYSLQKLLYGE